MWYCIFHNFYPSSKKRKEKCMNVKTRKNKKCKYLVYLKNRIKNEGIK